MATATAQRLVQALKLEDRKPLGIATLGGNTPVARGSAASKPPDPRKVPPVPEGITSDPLRRAISDLNRLRSAQVEARRTREQAVRDLERAKAADQASYAQAIRAGKADPGTPETQKAQAALDAATRAVAAHGDAVAQAEAELVAQVEAERFDLTGQADELVGDLTDRAGEQIAALRQTVSTLVGVLVFRGWAAGRASLHPSAPVVQQAEAALAVVQEAVERMRGWAGPSSAVEAGDDEEAGE
ncbi:MAG TPA: hypothetical protein VM305_01185 [Candidatus Limnocylindrales bacterium]|nr:hypothetical protein [Candidatus Limnocylindrales bacterium]